MQTIFLTAALSAGICNVTANISDDMNEITSTTDNVGNEVYTTPADLDIIEREIEARRFHVVRSYEVTTTQSEDVMTGEDARFTVYHNNGNVLEIRYATGARVPNASPQFTETAEAFAIDYQWMQMQDAIDVANAKY